MTNLAMHENVCRVKEVMGDTFADSLIIRALSLHQNNFERALNYLLEGNYDVQDPDQPSGELRDSITDAFAQNPHPPSPQPAPSGAPPGWGESDWTQATGPWVESGWTKPPPNSPPLPPPPGVDSSLMSDALLPTAAHGSALPPSEDADVREPEVLPSSPPKGPYQPVTVTGQTTPTEEARQADLTFRPQAPGPTSRPATSYQRLRGVGPTPPDLLVIDDNVDKRYQAELHAAIQASLASDSPLPKSSQQAQVVAEPRSLKDLTTEDEQMSKALEESLAMSGSRILEADGKFGHPPAHQRARVPGSPVALRVQNSHLVFLPCVLSAIYAAKPFRDRVLAFQPSPSPELSPLVEHDVEGLWNGKSSWRSGENWPDKPRPLEIILAIQRLFAMMTHTKRSYVDVHEVSLLLGYEEGEMISWSLNEPNKGCHRTYEVVAEAWRELAWEILQVQSPHGGGDEKVLEEYEKQRRLFHWRGHKLPLPLPRDDPSPSPFMASSDNSTTSLTLNTFASSLNDIYSCIDAQVWLPEANTAHFLDGTSLVLAFEIERKSKSSPYSWNAVSSSSHHLREANVPFSLEPEFWVDRYLLQKRHKIAELREEVSRIEGEADVSLARRAQLSTAGGKNFVDTIKATVEYLSTATQYPSIACADRENRKAQMLPKFQQALAKLERELSCLDGKAHTALAAAKSIFDVPEMKESGPHDLVSVVVSDGFSGRDHMWTYLRSDDGRWFKSLDRSAVEVPLETVLSDPAGLHMNSGHIFAVYVQRPSPGGIVDSTDIPLPPKLQESISKDNELFAAEMLESTALGHTHYTDVGSEVVMRSESPRSDIAEAGGGFEFELPLRLSGGAGLCDEGSDGADHESEESSDDGHSEIVELGFLQPTKHRLDIRTMTGKVGGRPIWLDPTRPLDPCSLTCSSCGEPLSFLLQMNAPEDSNPGAYYRTIYIFICRKMSCIRLNGPGALKAFRAQLDKYQMNPDTLENTKIKEPPLSPAFRDWELICAGEPSDEVEVLRMCSMSSSLPKVDSKSDLDAKTADTKPPVDDAFLRFQSRISRAPAQVVRYLRVSSPPAAPLWASDLPPDGPTSWLCSECGTTKTAEFQVLSTILSYLGAEVRVGADPEALDFGTIIVYTCPKSCLAVVPHHGPPANGYLSGLDGSIWAQEICLAQMFSNEGIQFKL